MTFYLNPPSGNISLQTLEKFAHTRLDFLLKISLYGSDKLKLQDAVTDFFTVAGSECLIDGSYKDVVSHFILRLILSQDHDTKEFLLKAEQQLFKFRFQCMSEDELSKSLKRTDLHLKKIRFNPLILSTDDFEKLKNIGDIFKMITSREKRWILIVQRYLAGENKDGFQIPFSIVPQLVAKRQVKLESGLALVPFCKLEDVISHIWYQLMLWGVNRASRVQKTFLQDKRIRKLTRQIQAMFRKHHGTYEESPLNETYLSHDQVSLEVTAMFPPCMSHVHNILSSRHRLQHNARIQYTLFLKEIGMPVHEALMFWRKEYSEPVESSDGCCHRWQQDGRRYTYNIRHLYGLEGACINYRGHSCSTLQNSPSGVGEQGGCPFQCFDLEHLDRILQREEIHDSRKVIHQLASNGKYSEACKTLFVEKTKKMMQRMEDLCTHYLTDAQSGCDGYQENCEYKVMSNAKTNTTFDGSELDAFPHCPDRVGKDFFPSVKTSERHSVDDTNSDLSIETLECDFHKARTLSEDCEVTVRNSCPGSKYCPSSSETQNPERGIEVVFDHIYKPSQYYFSLRKLIEGLKHVKN